MTFRDKGFFFRIGRTILLGVAFVIIASISLAIVNAHYLDKRQRDAKVINLAGRQRMLSQKMAKSVYMFQLEGEYPQNIQKDAELWNHDYNALRYGDETLNIPKPPNRRIDSIFRNISPYQEHLYTTVKYRNERLTNASLEQIRVAETTFLVGMDAIVDLYQAEAEQGIYLIKVSTNIVTAAFVLLVLLGYFLILVPLIKGYALISKERDAETRNTKSILENTDDLIWSVDRDYRLLSFNSGLWQRPIRRDRYTTRTGR